MIYFDDGTILIRDLEREDIPEIVRGELEQGWNASDEKYLSRIKHRDEGVSRALAAEYEGKVAGYVNVYFSPQTGAFAGTGYPEIVDFGVLEKYRRHGIGSRLMDAAEDIARERSDTVWLGVGLHSGYGSAQRMYIKRGYIPDGSGVWYKDVICPPYAPCANDDDLVLYMSKKL